MSEDTIKEVIQIEDEDTLKDRYLTFYLGNEVYAFEIKYVTEIIGIQKITEVPNIKEHILGIINLRGIIVPVVDVRKRFSMPAIEYTERTCIIVVKVNNTEIGLLVDEVSEVMVIKSNIITTGPKTNKKTQSKFLEGMAKINNEVKLILNMKKLLYDSDQIITDEED
jgi:purine-binding chemotaxis protein CheW